MQKQELIIKTAKQLNLHEKQVEVVLQLLEEGATIPFIARYRKHLTNNLDENQIQAIFEVYEYENKLEKRKEAIIKSLDEKGLLDDELLKMINAASKLSELEAIYKPYKEGKKTKATEAIKLGLERLANWMLELHKTPELKEYAKQFANNDTIKNVDHAIELAKYIIAQKVSSDIETRQNLKTTIWKFGQIVSKLRKNVEDENETFKLYYDYKNRVTKLQAYQIMALNRGEEKKILNLSFDYLLDFSLKQAYFKFSKNYSSDTAKAVREAIDDSFKRLIVPSVENEVRNELTDNAHQQSILRFANNVEHLLLQNPIKDKVILGWDPGFRTGCKLAVIDPMNNVLAIDCVYPFDTKKTNETKTKLLDLINKHKVNIIAIGNGTASRESEEFISNFIKENKLDTNYCIVPETGASVYSASKIAQEEFPKLQVQERSAISIARRITDPLSELIKIPTESIGVGQYQHDLDKKALNERLDFVVNKVVNQVGVNANTVSKYLLSHISGLNMKLANEIIDYKQEHGKINNRKELLKIKGISDSIFEQCSGFLRILGTEPLDQTNIHPEDYELAYKIIEELGCTINDLNTDKLRKALDSANIDDLSNKFDANKITIEQIITFLKQPLRDYRQDYSQPLLKKEILKIEDLKEGLNLQARVSNITDFGAFVDIGIKQNALLHNSHMLIDNIPVEVSINDIINVQVLSIDIKNNKIQVQLIK